MGPAYSCTTSLTMVCSTSFIEVPKPLHFFESRAEFLLRQIFFTLSCRVNFSPVHFVSCVTVTSVHLRTLPQGP